MRLTIWIDGREAVPVRAIPYVTNWNISPDMLVSAFAGESESRPAISALQTFRNNDGVVSLVQSSGWERIKVQIDALDHRLPSDATGRAAWEEESVKLLPQGICVWLDEFVSAFSNDFSPASRIPDDRGEFPYLDFSPLLPNGVEEIVFHGFVRTSNHTATISYIDAEAAVENLQARIKGVFAKEFDLFVETGLLRAIDSDDGVLFDEREVSEFVPRKRFLAFSDLVERWEDRSNGRQGAIDQISEQVGRKRLLLYGGKATRRPAIEDAFFSLGEIVLAESDMFEAELGYEQVKSGAAKILDDHDFLSVAEAAKRWGVETNKLLHQADGGRLQLSVSLIGRNVHILRQRLEGYEGTLMPEIPMVFDVPIWAARAIARTGSAVVDELTCRDGMVVVGICDRLSLVVDDLLVTRKEIARFEAGSDVFRDRVVAIELAEDLPRSDQLGGDSPKPMQRSLYQDQVILETIRKLGFDPENLPPIQPGKPWVKSKVWNVVKGNKVFSEKVFKKAWERFNKDRTA